MERFDLRLWPGFAAAGGDTSSPAPVNQIVIDSRRVTSPDALFVALPGGTRDGHHFVSHAAVQGARFVLMRRGMPAPNTLKSLFVEDPLTALQEIAAIYRQQRNATVIAVTGSFGKTMLKDLLYHLVSSHFPTSASPESFNSQIGVALSLLNIADQDRLAIVEAGISLPGDMKSLAKMIAPDHVIITSIGEQHLATMGNTASIAREKVSLAHSLPAHGWLLGPSQTKAALAAQSLNALFWDQPKSEFPTLERFPKIQAYQLHFPDGATYEAKLSGTYHADLISIAVQAAWLLGVSSTSIIAHLKDYRIETTRTEVWHSSQASTLINSPYSADPQSVEIALKHLADTPPGSRKTFVFGGLRSLSKDPLAELTCIARTIQRSAIDAVALFGPQDLNPLVDVLKEGSPSLPVTVFPSLAEALGIISTHATSHDHILLKGPNKPPLQTVTEAFGDTLPANICTINLAAIDHNLSCIRQRLAPGTRVMAMVKALAYGTEDIRMSKFLQSRGVDILGVSFVDEGIHLKRAGVSQAVFALNALPIEARKAVQWNIEVGVSDITLIDALAQEATKHNKTLKVHLHVNTGMGRLGCRVEDAIALAHRIASHPSLVFEGIMTHLACAESPDDDMFTLSQYARFLDLVSTLEGQGFQIPWKHIANSAAAIRHPFGICNMVRIGLAFYGLHASAATSNAIDLKLAISLTSRIVGINHCLQGETIGYGRRYRTTRAAERIAVLPLGYFDGLHRQFSGKAFVLINGERAPMVGNICMDYMMIDITDLPDAQVGDEVLIFGHDAHGHYLSPEELATTVGSIAHQLVTCLGPRVKRLFIYE